MLDNYEELDLSLLKLSKNEQKLKPIVFNSENNIIALKSIETIVELEKEWKDVQKFIAGHIQSDLEQFELPNKLIWNIYLLFIIPKNIEIKEDFINQIESNKFCCKKYVLKVDDINNNENVKDVIVKQIPLFSHFDFSISEAISSDENIIKHSIYEKTNKRQLANKFLTSIDIKNKIEEHEIKSFINTLKEEYQSENRADSV
ncbi:MAG: Unknown protein [uncultured Campylobacterales bacterium]|uniref:Uncharacterized protein n=1 Tax=uncultured Campylobacterales bacterium TaxID=352960 RepID=A0A6S6SNQ0_9BACT|nr:MAG: Unknown protein [uncultured Campylobacterales bacterium]